MLRGCFSAAGPDKLVMGEDQINTEKYREILEEKLIQCARELRLGRKCIFQQDSNPKHTARATQTSFNYKLVYVL